MPRTTPQRGTFASTMGPYSDPRFERRARLIPVPPSLDLLPRPRFSLADELRLFARVLQAARWERVLLLFSSRGRLKPELLAIATLACLPRRLRPTIVLYGEMFEPNPGLRGWLERRFMQLVDRAVTRYAVHSAAERAVFATTWSIDAGKVAVCHLFHPFQDLGDTSIEAPRGDIFAGGNAFRDYETLLAAARQLPDVTFVIGTTRLTSRTNLPANVWAGGLPHAVFSAAMQRARAVVVPVYPGLRRGAGMMTYLEAMALKKPTIVADALAVREYVIDGVTGLVVDGSSEGYVRAIRWILDPANQDAARRMGEQAHGAVQQRFTLDTFVTELLAAVDAAQGSGTSGAVDPDTVRHQSIAG